MAAMFQGRRCDCLHITQVSTCFAVLLLAQRCFKSKEGKGRSSNRRPDWVTCVAPNLFQKAPLLSTREGNRRRKSHTCIVSVSRLFAYILTQDVQFTVPMWPPHTRVSLNLGRGHYRTGSKCLHGNDFRAALASYVDAALESEDSGFHWRA